ncbi:hypothetical protein SKAU_G00181110 [Synaphobranchus kaupii]|uniref:Uncharacterized protein n=1 Tax=Synaphobranchus kaupii TaxID=118154 RepID=A0A9Q1FMH6_SYNKA|nr:hypothetical protein SKAU_G00181110 [Synaphobranchus kaupii]
MNVAQVATQLSSSVEQDRDAFWEYPCDADSGGEEKNEEGGKWCNSNREKNYYDPASEIMRLGYSKPPGLRSYCGGKRTDQWLV